VREDAQEVILGAVGNFGGFLGGAKLLLMVLLQVMSRATFETPMIFPVSSRTGEIVTDTFSSRPSLVWRMVSK